MCNILRKIVVIVFAAVMVANLGLNLYAAAAPMDFDGIERKRKAEDSAYGEREAKHRKIDSIASAGDLSSKYGNKYANLERLQCKIAKNKKLEQMLRELGGYSVEVPAFTGLSDAQGKGFLRAQGLDVVQEWAQIPAQANGEEFLKAAQAISDKITQKGESGVNVFPKIPMLKHLALKQIAERSGSRLMVRSTGAEDTEQLSNAGGNESVANVEPTWSAITQATDKVEASYLDEKSIGQRKIEGDKTISQCPKSAVLYQEMIGEQEGGAADIRQIPVGCVVYTQEAYANTSGVTIIQASWGHSTGVVDNTVAVDTYTVDANDNVNALIKIKPERWIPVFKDGKHKLEKIKNPQEIQGQAVLTQQDALAIKAVADAIHRKYGRVMDIELVYMPHEKKIYLVQARPLKATSQFNPSYLQTLDGIEQENLLHGATVLPGNCELRRITNKDHVVVANTLNDALTIFDSFDEAEKKAKQDAVKAIIVQGGAETTSHPAAIFRGVGKPVLVVHDIEKIRQWLQSDNASIVVDIQRGIIVNKQLDQIVRSDGWFTHPMPKKISIPNVPVQKTQDAFIDSYPDKSLAALVDMLKCAGQAEAQQALDSILSKIEQDLRNVRADQSDPLKKYVADAAIIKLEQLFGYACACAANIQAKLALPAFDLKRLYTVHFMECLLFQRKDDACINVFSFESVMASYAKEFKFVDTLKNKAGDANALKIVQHPHLFRIALKGFDCALVESTEGLWLDFVARVANSDATTQQNFSHVANLMIDFNALSAWINAIFSTTWKVGGYVEEFVGALCGEVNQAEDFLKFLQDLKQKIKTFDLSKWEEPASFAKNYQDFVSELVETCMTEKFKVSLSGSRQLIKLIALGMMDSLVELFDQSIKKLKGSTKYASIEDKVKNFKVMLGGYFNLLENWLSLLSAGALIYHSNWPLQKYLNTIRCILDTLKNDAEQLSPTREFSVANAALGSTTEFERNFPRRAEDVFTLIHQNILIVMGSMIKATLPDAWAKPNLFAKAEDVLLKLDIKAGLEAHPLTFPTSFPWLMSTKFENKKLYSRYNCPLRNHSVVFELSFDKAKNETLITTKFVGQDRSIRWPFIQKFAQIQGVSVLKVKESTIGANELFITQIVADDSDVNDSLARSMQLMCRCSVLPIVYTKASFYLGDLIKKVISEGKAYSEVKNIFFAVFESSGRVKMNEFFKQGLLHGLKNLVPAGGATPEITSNLTAFAGRAIFENNTDFRCAGLSLFKELFEKSDAPPYKEATVAAVKAMTDINFSDRNLGLELFKELFEKSDAPPYKEATVVAVRAMKDIGASGRVLGLGLFKVLVEKSYAPAYQEATVAAGEAVTERYPWIRASGFKLFKALVEKPELKESVQKQIRKITENPALYIDVKEELEGLL